MRDILKNSESIREHFHKDLGIKLNRSDQDENIN